LAGVAIAGRTWITQRLHPGYGSGVQVKVSRLAAVGLLVLCGGAAVLSLAILLGGVAPVAVVIPLGPPGTAMTLAVDGLAAFFLLLLSLGGCAAGVAALDDGRAGPSLLLFGAMAFTVFAADGFALVLGVGLTALAARQESVGAVLAVVCLVAALALLGDGGWGFAAMRAHAPDGWRAGVVLVLVLLGAGSVLLGAATQIGIYVLIRVLFDLCGPATPSWWGSSLMLLGAAGALLGALRANMAGDLQAILGWATVTNVGKILAALGVALAARAADLVPLATLALGAALLLALAHAAFMSLLLLGARAVELGAGTRRLDRLGGLIHSMPVTTGCMLAGAAALAALPPTAGFAGQWMLFQAVFGAPRTGGLGVQLLTSGVVVGLALASALGAAAAVRLVGVALLGRPRSPRAAAAAEAGAATRMAMLGLAVVTGLVGLFPGAVLGLAGPALRLLTGAVRTEEPGYVAPAIAVLLLLAGAAAVRWTRGGTQEAQAWESGAEPPPPWLPFGDPLTQYGGASLAEPLRRVLGTGFFQIALPYRDIVAGFSERLSVATVRRALAAMAVLVVVALLVVAVAEQL
jgi:formate hydrogenlyase subunit 3/multisubunit Na+/H+ antiporter MnhD subunit